MAPDVQEGDKCSSSCLDLGCLSGLTQVSNETDWFSFVNYSLFNFSPFNYFISIGLIIDISSRLLQWSLM